MELKDRTKVHESYPIKAFISKSMKQIKKQIIYGKSSKEKLKIIKN